MTKDDYLIICDDFSIFICRRVMTVGIFIDDSAIGRVNELCKKYQEIYGKRIDFNIIPKGISQEKLVKCLELMIDNNISLIDAYEKLYCK